MGRVGNDIVRDFCFNLYRLLTVMFIDYSYRSMTLLYTKSVKLSIIVVSSLDQYVKQ